MIDAQLADELITRLNNLMQESDETNYMVKVLMGAFVSVSKKLAEEHPTIQARASFGGKDIVTVLGLLNGLVGVIKEGPKAGYGYIAAEIDEHKDVLRFRRTDDADKRSSYPLSDQVSNAYSSTEAKIKHCVQRAESAEKSYGADAPISDGSKMWAARYADDVPWLIEQLRAAKEGGEK